MKLAILKTLRIYAMDIKEDKYFSETCTYIVLAETEGREAG
jgi:hypothetical protein